MFPGGAAPGVGRRAGGSGRRRGAAVLLAGVCGLLAAGAGSPGRDSAPAPAGARSPVRDSPPASAGAGSPERDSAPASAGGGSPERYSRRTVGCSIPDVTLVDQGGARVRLANELARPGPVLVQFIFTTCSTICPVLAGTFAAVAKRLPDARLLSISIDPDEDTPARLAAYAERFGAGPRWRLLTGRLEDVIAVERGFDAYRGNKMRHEPLTWARAAPGQPWLRLEGLPTAADLAAEVRTLAAATGAPAGGAEEGTAAERLAKDARVAAARAAGQASATARAAAPAPPAPPATPAVPAVTAAPAMTAAPAVTAPPAAPATTAATARAAAVPGTALPVGAGAEATAAAAARGRRIYRDGVLPSGRPVRAVVAGEAGGGGTEGVAGGAGGGGAEGVAVETARLACAGCHRASGYGGVEGGTLVPPITAPALFGGRQPAPAELLGKLYREELAQASWTRLRSAAVAQRPAYTSETLAAAVRRGTDPRGRALDPLMPRYELDAGAMADLAAYLRTLSAAPASGVDAAVIHFAVVVAGDVEPERRRAMLDVARAFCAAKNGDTRRQLSRPPASPGYRDELRQTWREWALHVWELRGPEATWGAQLERSYGAQPVFALLSGIATGAARWRPVHEFCERREVPCVFPNTDLPVVSPPGAWTLYLSAGLALEGRALARHLVELGGSGQAAGRVVEQAAERVVQVYRDTAPGHTAAAALREAMAGAAAPVHVEELVIGADAPAPAAALAARLDGRRPAAVVLWLDRRDAAALLPALVTGAAGGTPGSPGAGGPDGGACAGGPTGTAGAASSAGVRQLYLSYSLLGETLPPLPAVLRERTRLTYRFALPGRPAPEGNRARAWLRSRAVAGPHERIRLDTYFALAMAGDALERLAGRFSREYFVETIERETERAANPGVFPRLGLGAGQRFAAKGCYLVKLAAAGAEPPLLAEGDWIVPTAGVN